MRQLIQIAGVVLALTLSAPAIAGDKGADEAASILSRIESNIHDIRLQSDRLMSYNRAPDQYDWRLHASELNRISNEAEDIASLIKEFDAMKDQATYRQQYSFNKVVNLMAKISESTEGAIKVLNDNKSMVEVAHPDYAEKITAIFDSSDEAIQALGVAESWFELQDAWKS